MILSACLIVKDDSELELLERAVDSLNYHVDGIYITATNPSPKIKKLCEDNGLHYSYYKWDDSFANARNFNFSQVPPTTDYIFWMDTDDVLVNGEYLKEIAALTKENRKDVVFLTYWYGVTFNGDPIPENIKTLDLVQMRERLIRPGVIHWEGRLHETPMPNENVKHTYTSVEFKDQYIAGKSWPIAILHTSDNRVLPEKMERNQRLLELQLSDEKKKGGADPRTLLYLMKIYTESDKSTPETWKKTLEMGKEYLSKSGWNEERGTCWELMGQVHGHMGDFKQATECFHKAIAEWPHNVLFYIRLASSYYNLQDYKACKFWMDLASNMDMDKRFTSSMTNMHAMKALFADLLMKYTFNVEKDVKKAYEASNMLYQESPTEENKQNNLYLADKKDLEEACRNVDYLCRYLHEIGQDGQIVSILDILPDALSEQPYAIRLRNQFTPARRWGENEICYFANFNAPHFEKWDSTSLTKGIGGSETAVIKLSERWAKYGYKVTVYGDPFTKGVQNGVNYLPYYYFNSRDYFNIFIQWRSWALAGKIKAKKFFVDLHDIYSAVDITPNQLNNIDAFMVKSKYHRSLAPTIPQEKFKIIGNGF